MKGPGDAHYASESRERDRRLVLRIRKGQSLLQNTQRSGRVLRPEQNNVLETHDSWRELGEAGQQKARDKQGSYCKQERKPEDGWQKHPRHILKRLATMSQWPSISLSSLSNGSKWPQVSITALGL